MTPPRDPVSPAVEPIAVDRSMATARERLIVLEALVDEARWWKKYHGRDFNGEGDKRLAALEKEWDAAADKVLSDALAIPDSTPPAPRRHQMDVGSTGAEHDSNCWCHNPDERRKEEERMKLSVQPSDKPAEGTRPKCAARYCSALAKTGSVYCDGHDAGAKADALKRAAQQPTASEPPVTSCLSDIDSITSEDIPASIPECNCGAVATEHCNVHGDFTNGPAPSEQEMGGARLRDAQAALEHDRAKVAECVTAVKHALRNYSWLIEGRGSYEWDDDRWHGEFRQACDNIAEAIGPMIRIAADWSNCPQKWEDIQTARRRAALQSGDNRAGLRKLIASWREPTSLHPYRDEKKCADELESELLGQTSDGERAMAGAQWAIIITGEGATARLATDANLREELHRAWCVCGQSWQNCKTEGIAEDIRRMDDEDDWVNDEDGQRFAMQWRCETGTIGIYKLAGIPASAPPSLSPLSPPQDGQQHGYRNKKAKGGSND